MPSVQRPAETPARLGRVPVQELRLRRQLAKVRAENRILRQQVAELEDLVADLDPSGEGRYAWLFGIG